MRPGRQIGAAGRAFCRRIGCSLTARSWSGGYSISKSPCPIVLPTWTIEWHESAAEAGLRFRRVDLFLDRPVEPAVEEDRVIVAAGAPFRRLRAADVLHVLDRLAVPLVVERREVVRRRVPLVVDVLVTARAHGARHEEVRRDDAADVRVGRRRKERAVGTAPFLLHRQRRHERVLDAVRLAARRVTARAVRDRSQRRDRDERDRDVRDPRPAKGARGVPQRRAEDPRTRRGHSRVRGHQRRLRPGGAGEQDPDTGDEPEGQERRRDETDDAGLQVSDERSRRQRRQCQAERRVQRDVGVVPQRGGRESVEIRRADQQDDEPGRMERHRSPLVSEQEIASQIVAHGSSARKSRPYPATPAGRRVHLRLFCSNTGHRGPGFDVTAPITCVALSEAGRTPAASRRTYAQAIRRLPFTSEILSYRAEYRPSSRVAYDNQACPKLLPREVRHDPDRSSTRCRCRT